MASSPAELARARARYAGLCAGTWQPKVPSSRVADHINQLMAAGMTIAAIAEAAGVHRGTIRNARQQLVGNTYGPTAAAILAVHPKPLPGRYLPAAGTQRRIQALTAIGYTLGVQENLCGVAASTLHYIATTDDREGVTPAVAAAVAEMYLWHADRPQPRDKWTARAMNAARRRRWLPPTAWTEATINDPDATPYSAQPDADDQPDDIAVEQVLAGGRPWRSLTRDADRLEVVRVLVGRGLKASTIESRLSTSRAVVNKLLDRLAADAEAAA